MGCGATTLCVAVVLLDAGTGYVTIHALLVAGPAPPPEPEANRSTMTIADAQTAMMTMILRFIHS